MRSFYKVWTSSNNIYNNCKCCTMLSSFVVWSSIIFALFFPVFGIGLAFFVMSFLCVGLKKNVLDCVENKQVVVENVFNYYKQAITCFCLKVCSTFLVMLWSLLLIVPGIIAGLNYSFAPYIFSENVNLKTLECLDLSKKLVYGRRVELFLIYITEFLLIVMFTLFFCSLLIILNFIVNIPLWIKIVVPIIIAIVIFLIFIQPYFEILIANLYVDAKNSGKKAVRQKSVKTASKD